MKIIGIDPGLAATGIGIIEGRGLVVSGYAYGSVHTSARAEFADRLNHIYHRLTEWMTQEQPDLVIIEDAFSLKRYPKSGIALGKVIGVIMLAAVHINATIKEVSVREVKKILTGNGNANKGQLEAAIRHRLKVPEPIKPDHASDALGLALVGLYRQDLGKRT
jgi:crossover junction endodeoxyribonuclease RuvC